MWRQVLTVPIRCARTQLQLSIVRKNGSLSYSQFCKARLAANNLHDATRLQSQGLLNCQQWRYASSSEQKSLRKEVQFEELIDLLENGDVHVIDVREPQELETHGKIPNSTNIPLGKLREALLMSPKQFKKSYGIEKPNEDDTFVFHCRTGVRSLKALTLADGLGFKNAKHYPGGWQDWASKHKT